MNDIDRTQLSENMRFYGDMRFKQLTLMMAWMTLVGVGVAQYGEQCFFLDFQMRSILALWAVIFSGVMWVMEVRSTIAWVAQREQAPEVWPRPPKAKMKWLNATNAVLIFYIAIYSFWSWAAFLWSNSWIQLAIFVVIGALLIGFTVANYLYLWKHKE